MARRLLIFVGVMAVIVGLAFVISAKSKQDRESFQPTKPSGPVPVAAVEVAKGMLEDKMTFTGTVRSPSSVVVVSKTMGTIEKKAFRKGDAVRKGDVLYEAEKDTALANKKRAVSGVEAAKAALAQAEAAFKNAESEYTRSKKLFQQGSVTRQMLDGAETAYKAAKAALDAADAGLKNGEAALELADIALGDSTIKSPSDGKVTEDFDLEPGSTVNMGMPVAAVVQTAELRAELQIPEGFLSRVRKGTRVYILPEGYPGKIDAEITLVNPQVSERSRSAEVWASFKTPVDDKGAELVRPGQFCRVEVVVSSQEGVIVPASAMVKRGNLETVMVVEAGKVRAFPVTAGLATSREVVVLGGLNGGETVVSSGARLLTDGDSVQVTDGTVRVTDDVK